METRLCYGNAMAAALLAGCLPATARPGEKPNIVFILADDLGYGDLSCYGQQRFSTPNIDRLAAEGMIFTDHYSGCAVSAPSRSVLMSGLHTGHTTVRGNRQNPDTPEGQIPISADTETIAEMLKKEGYVTGAFGKWGLGYPGTEGDPNRQGFDEFFGYNCQAVAHRYYPEYLWHNDEKVYLEGNTGWMKKCTYSADLIHEKALEFIKENRDSCFFLFFPTTLPHAELTVPEDHVLDSMKTVFGPETPYTGEEGDAGTEYGEGLIIRKYCRQEHPHAVFASMVLRLDRYVGEIMAALEKYGIDDNTVIFFSSDNGPHDAGGADPEFFNGNGPLRGIKGDFYEGGIRVPLIVRWNGHIRESSVSRHVSAFCDVKPTLADIAPADFEEPTDGISFLPELTGKKQPEHDFLYWEIHTVKGAQAVRMGNWKGVRNGMSKNPDAHIELYDLSSDIAESRDVSGEHPDIVRKIDACMKAAHVRGDKFRFAYEQDK